MSENASGPKTWSRSIIALVLGVGLLIAFGIAQPLILGAAKVGKTGDLTDADVLSILVAVVALLTASAEAIIYTGIQDKLNATIRAAKLELD
jgi:hypothetical protein